MFILECGWILFILCFSIFRFSCGQRFKSYSLVCIPQEYSYVNDKVFYFGIGSNMLKSKVINRGINGSLIDILSMRPAKCHDHRLAFNLRGFPPLEPCMAGIEVCDGAICHGSLIEMSPDEYKKLWISEGGAQENPPYNQIIVQVTPYGSEEKIAALAFQTAEHAKLGRELPPSKRYMKILLEGAHELGLEDSYVKMLKDIPTATSSFMVRTLALFSLLAYSSLMRSKSVVLKSIPRQFSRIVTKIYSLNSFRNTNETFGDMLIRRIRFLISEITMSCVLILPALAGALIMMKMKVTREPLPPMLRNMWNAHIKENN